MMLYSSYRLTCVAEQVFVRPDAVAARNRRIVKVHDANNSGEVLVQHGDWNKKRLLSDTDKNWI